MSLLLIKAVTAYKEESLQVEVFSVLQSLYSLVGEKRICNLSRARLNRAKSLDVFNIYVF